MSEKKEKKKRTNEVSKYYKKKSQHQHVLDEPDNYIGCVENDWKKVWIYDEELDSIVQKEIYYNEGLYKTIDELIVNARDRTIVDKSCNEISVNINQEEGSIEVYNNGKGVPVVIHDEHKQYIPELIFGTLLTSSNYDTKSKTVGGKNGEGAKLANIFSKRFIIETIDEKEKKFYKQEWRNNMFEKDEPEITKSSKKPYTKITYYPDFKKFESEELTNDMKSLIYRRIYDIAGCTNKKVKVMLNNKRIPVRNFSDYIKLFYDEEDEIKKILVEETPNEDWEVGVAYNPNGFSHASLVNGINTPDGGTHVEHVLDKVFKGVKEELSNNKNYKKISEYIKPKDVKTNVMIFINCVVEDPSFQGQTKQKLSKSTTKWRSQCELSKEFFKSLINTGLGEKLYMTYTEKEEKELKKTDGKKTGKIKDLPKLDDAHEAGKGKSQDTYLFLTEGDSAKHYAVSGLSVLGQDYFGVFPLRGKLINVSSNSPQKIAKNQEFVNIKKIVGLENRVDYGKNENFKKLRYGHIIILADQDDDGKHIAGLITNVFREFWPSLLKRNDFLLTFPTPLVKATKTSTSKKKNPIVKEFYNNKQLNDFYQSEDVSKWKLKYYKGLGTSTGNEAKESFKYFNERILNFYWEQIDKNKDEIIDENKESPSWQALELAFGKTNRNARKEWLKEYNENDVAVIEENKLPYSIFINKEVKHYSYQSNIRSIPKLADGFKESQRKIIYGMFQSNLFNDELKVTQVSNKVSEKTEYHHGETSLEAAIICLAQNYPGSNNINLIKPSGNFGSRAMNGKDASQTRYIFTKVEPIAKKIFRKEDNCILENLVEDGKKIEPREFYPIIPLVLINGGSGVGTGYSTEIFNYNPKDIVNCLKKIIKGKTPKEPVPWYRGFGGSIEKIGNNKYQANGKYEVLDDKSIKITELPIVNGMSITNYKTFIESITSDDRKESDNKNVILTDFIHNAHSNKIDFTLYFSSNNLQNLIKTETLEKKLKLNKKFSNTNMHLFDSNGIMKKYRSVLDIISDFYDIRLKKYQERKNYYIKQLEKELELLKYKIKYIKNVNDGTINIKKLTSEYLIGKLEELEFPKLSTNESTEKSYKYLTSMYILSLTKDKVEELQNEKDNKEAELSEYRKKTEEEIWEKELDEFIEEYEKMMKEYYEELDREFDDSECIKKSKKGKKSKK